MKLHDVAAAIGGSFIGDGERELIRVASLTAAGPQDVAFVQDAKLAPRAKASRAGALIVGEAAVPALEGKALIVTRNPRLAFAKAGALLARRHVLPVSIHPSAVIDPAARLAENVTVGALAYIGPHVSIGRGTIVGPGCMILSDCEIGEDCQLVARVTVYPQTKVGARAVLHAGVVLGSDGFGFVPDEAGRYHKFPQIGQLEIGNDVEIGANSTIDRGALDATVIADGVKLDNLVQIGHNVRLEDNVVVVAQTGVSGSSVLERNVLVGGQVGIGDHVRIEAGAVLGAQAGVPSKKVIRGKGVVFWGTPARPLSQHLRELATLSRLAKRQRASLR